VLHFNILGYLNVMPSPRGFVLQLFICFQDISSQLIYNQKIQAAMAQDVESVLHLLADRCFRLKCLLRSPGVQEQ
jgi:hypothetical protein